jgi:N-hydroxyarylamine O-acetyltransferase
VDVGAGNLSLTAAIPFAFGRVSPTPHETRRLVEEDGRYFHQVLRGDAWTDLYEFHLEELHPIDQEVGNWWTSTSPSSRFRQQLCVAKALPDGGRVALVDDELKLRSPDGSATGRRIESWDDLEVALTDTFELAVPPGCRFTVRGAAWSSSVAGVAPHDPSP